MTDRDHLRAVLAGLLTECVQEHKSLLDDVTHYISEDLADAEWGALADHAADAIHHSAMLSAYEHALNLVRHAVPQEGDTP